ncbi:MAG TPA: 4-hydroxy-tetrahydrodipicolinate synthase [bacterium]|nr:4-hydroxy-tetrahydrodipicolinate synthase [bacterium]HPN43692.1 4-hydroxy-tetrahydrodipicolinate synthase [bacterium]
MDFSRFRGTTVALITPFLANGAVDEAGYKKLLDWQIALGTDVILTCGTTGESATLSHIEHEKVIELTIHHVNGRVPVLCGAGSNATSEAISLSKFAEKAGADAILSVAPYYNKPTQEGLYQHFKAIAESVKTPVILYNVPGRTGSNISAQTTLRLAQISNIIGIKEASGNFSQIMAILKDRPKGFLVLSGDDAITLPMIAAGADGIISVVANQAPALLHEMVHSALNNQWERARELHYKLLPLMEFNFIESNPIPVKTGVALMGLIEENFRLPLVKMTDANRQTMKKMLADLGLL